MRKALMSLTAIAVGGAALTGAIAADRSIRGQDRAAAAEADFQKAIAGLTPGKPMQCLPIGRLNLSLKAYGPMLVYRANRKLLYVNRTAGGCENVARGDILVSRQFSGRACSGDIAQTIDRTSRFPTGGCALGDFVTYRAR